MPGGRSVAANLRGSKRKCDFRATRRLRRWAPVLYCFWLLRKRDYALRAWDKLLERRIMAPEDVIAMALEMRVMVGLGGVEESDEVARSPPVLSSKDEFEHWFVRFT